MEKEIIVQLIQTVGAFVLFIGGFFSVKYFMNIKEKFGSEKRLLQEAAFYREIIKKYDELCVERGIGSKKLLFWKQVREELNLKTPELTQPNALRQRLDKLNALDVKLESVLDKTNIGDL